MPVQTLPTPAATGQLQAIVNVTQSILSYSAYRGGEILWTDTQKSLVEGNQASAYGDVIDYGNSQTPFPRLGFYHSISDAVIDPLWYISDPPMQFLTTDVLNSELLSAYTVPSGVPGYPALRVVDYAQSTARTKLLNTLVTRATEFKNTYGVDLVFLDNCRHPANGSFPIAWSDTLSYLADLRAALHAIDVALIVNFTMPPGIGSDASYRAIWPALGALVEGIAFEAPVLREQIRTPAAVANLLTDYQAMLTAGATPILMVNQAEAVGASFIQRYTNESDFLARLAMILDGPLVAQYFYLPQQDWFPWPAQRGPPTGPIVQTGTLVSRAFASGDITVDFGTRTQSVGMFPRLFFPELYFPGLYFPYSTTVATSEAGPFVVESAMIFQAGAVAAQID